MNLNSIACTERATTKAPGLQGKARAVQMAGASVLRARTVASANNDCEGHHRLAAGDGGGRCHRVGLVARNMASTAIVLVHGLRRLLPPY